MKGNTIVTPVATERKYWRRSAVYMGAGPAVMYATHALDAFTQFENENTLAPAQAFQSCG